MNKLIDKVFMASDAIRYVVIYHDNKLISKHRSNIEDASFTDSDKHEELFVYPTMLKIAGQRGRLDCGGLNYIIISYGNFYQMIQEFKSGHISICVDKEQNPIELEPILNKIINKMIDAWR